MDRLLLKAKIERIIKQSLDNLEPVTMSNLQKARAIALELSFALPSLFNEELEGEKHNVSERR